MNATLESLIFVVRQSEAQIQNLSDSLEMARGGEIEPILRALGKEADVCSAALARLSRHYSETLPSDQDGQVAEPQSDQRLLVLADRLNQARVSGFCTKCGGVLPTNT